MELQDIPTIYLEQEMGIEIEDKTLEALEQRIDPCVISLAEGEIQVTILPANIATPEETPWVHRSSRVIFQTKPYYIPIISGNQYETINTQVECEETLDLDAHMFFFQ